LLLLSLLLLSLSLLFEELEPLELARPELRLEPELPPSLPGTSGNCGCRIRPRPCLALAPPISFGSSQSSSPTACSICLFGFLGLGVHVGSNNFRYTERSAK
jgi:hypothetical protein